MNDQNFVLKKGQFFGIRNTYTIYLFMHICANEIRIADIILIKLFINTVNNNNIYLF